VLDLLLAGSDPAALAAAGVAWLVVESDTAGDMGTATRTLDRLTPTYRDQRFALYRIGDQSVPGPSARVRATVIAAHLAWLAMLIVGGAGVAGCWAAELRRARRDT
jgi:hypothetical protein